MNRLNERSGAKLREGILKVDRKTGQGVGDGA
jgi:hypothetical protein